MFSGPQQPDFFCSTPAHLAGFDLTGPFLDADCSLPTRVDHYYRSTANTWRPYDPRRTPPRRHEHHDTERRRLRDPVGARHDQPVHLLDRRARPRCDRPGDAAALEPQADLLLRRRRGDRPLPGLQQPERVPLRLRARAGLRDRVVDRHEDQHALQPGAGRRDRDDGQVAVRRPSTATPCTRSGSAVPAAASSSTCTARTTRACSTARSRSTPTRTWSPRPSTSATASCSNAGWTRRCCADPASKWRQWSNRSLLEGLASSDTVANPYQPLTPWLAAPGSTECVNGWRGLSPLALNPKFGTAPGITPEQQAQVEWTHWNDAVNVYGRDPVTGYARSTWDNVGVQYGLKALVDGDLTPAEFLDLNATVGGWKHAAGRRAGGLPVHPAGLSVRCGRVERAEHHPAGRERRAPRGPRATSRPCAPRTGPGSCSTAASTSRSSTGATTSTRELDMHNARQSFASRQRMHRPAGQRGEPGRVVHRRPPGPRVRPDPDGARGDGRSGSATCAPTRRAAWPATSRPRRWTAASPPTARCSTAAATRGAASSTTARTARAPSGSRSTARPARSRAARSTSSSTSARCSRCSAAVARGLYGSWRPSAAELDRLEQIFPTGVCDYRKPDVGRPR